MRLTALGCGSTTRSFRLGHEADLATEVVHSDEARPRGVRISDEPLRPSTLIRFDSCQALCGGSLVRPPLACTRARPCAVIGRSGGAL